MVGAWGRSQHCPALLAKQLGAGQRHEREVKTPLKESISCIFSRKRGKLHKEDAHSVCVPYKAGCSLGCREQVMFPVSLGQMENTPRSRGRDPHLSQSSSASLTHALASHLQLL